MHICTTILQLCSDDLIFGVCVGFDYASFMQEIATVEMIS